MIEIFVALRGEGTAAWRPVQALEVRPGIYEISPAPEMEDWEFGAGERVRCERRTFADGRSGLVAVERVAAAV